MNAPDPEIALSGGGRTAVHRQDQVVIRQTGPWAAAIHALLRHLEAVGFVGSPRLVGSGRDATGRETLTYIEGEFMQPGPWTLEGAATVGQLLRALHRATTSFHPAPGAVWRPWFGRALGGPARAIGHCCSRRAWPARRQAIARRSTAPRSTRRR